MNPNGNQILIELLRAGQRNLNNTRTVKLKVDKLRHLYSNDIADRDELHAFLSIVKRETKSIDLVWEKGMEHGRYDPRHIALSELKEIILIDLNALAVYLGIKTSVEKTQDLITSIRPQLENNAAWILELFDKSCEKWRLGKPSYIEVDESAKIKNLFLALKHVANGDHIGKDMRTFSRKFLSNSKAFEEIACHFANAWRINHPDWQNRVYVDYDHRDLLQELELVKFTELKFKGNLQAKLENGWVDYSKALPFTCLSPNHVTDIRFAVMPSYILTIENLASFYRYAEEINDGGIIFYTNGYPSLKCQEFFNKLSKSLPEYVPFYHWGDIDVDGLKIIKVMSRTTQRHVIPFLMDIDVLNDYRNEGIPLTNDEIKNMKKIAEGCDFVAGIANNILNNELHYKVEQESIDPVSPLRHLIQQAA